MVCLHEAQHLVGSSDGIFCRKCGRKFVDFKAIENERKSSNLTANAEKNGEAKEIIEEEKKTAVPAKGRATKGAKSTKKKAVSE